MKKHISNHLGIYLFVFGMVIVVIAINPWYLFEHWLISTVIGCILTLVGYAIFKYERCSSPLSKRRPKDEN